MNEIYNMVGWYPYAGTLNVRVKELATILKQLPTPLQETEADTKIGPLQWWLGKLQLPGDVSVVCLLVRGKNTKTNYLEFVTQLPLRASTSVKNGDTVYFTLSGL